MAAVSFALSVINDLESAGLLSCSAAEARGHFSEFSEVLIVSSRSKASSKREASKVKVTAKPSVILPFCGAVVSDWCNGVKFNHGLHTQCTNGASEAYCKSCQKQADNSATGKPVYGDIVDRAAFSVDYRDPKGKLTMPYANVAEKLGVSMVAAEAAAATLGWTIPADQLVKRLSKRGRPSEGKPVVKKKKRGRVAKAKESAPSQDDQIAQLVSEAYAEVESAVEPAEPVEVVEADEAVKVEAVKVKAVKVKAVKVKAVKVVKASKAVKAAEAKAAKAVKVAAAKALKDEAIAKKALAKEEAVAKKALAKAEAAKVKAEAIAKKALAKEELIAKKALAKEELTAKKALAKEVLAKAKADSVAKKVLEKELAVQEKLEKKAATLKAKQEKAAAKKAERNAAKVKAVEAVVELPELDIEEIEEDSSDDEEDGANEVVEKVVSWPEENEIEEDSSDDEEDEGFEIDEDHTMTVDGTEYYYGEQDGQTILFSMTTPPEPVGTYDKDTDTVLEAEFE
jgi:hypothetical protein